MDTEFGWVTVTETAAIAGCTVGWVRTLLNEKLLAGRKLGGSRTWLIRRTDAESLTGRLTTRSRGKKHEAKRPVSSRKKPARSPKR